MDLKIRNLALRQVYLCYQLFLFVLCTVMLCYVTSCHFRVLMECFLFLLLCGHSLLCAPWIFVFVNFSWIERTKVCVSSEMFMDVVSMLYGTFRVSSLLWTVCVTVMFCLFSSFLCLCLVLCQLSLFVICSHLINESWHAKC